MATVGRWPNNDTRFDDVRRIVSRRDAHDYGKNRVEGNVCAKLLDGPHARDRHGDATHIPGAIADDAIPDHARATHHELRAVAHAHAHRASAPACASADHRRGRRRPPHLDRDR